MYRINSKYLVKGTTTVLQTCFLRTLGNEQFLENFSTAVNMRLLRPLPKGTVRDSTPYTRDLLQFQNVGSNKL